jgi:hypothetical protein
VLKELQFFSRLSQNPQEESKYPFVEVQCHYDILLCISLVATQEFNIVKVPELTGRFEGTEWIKRVDYFNDERKK